MDEAEQAVADFLAAHGHVDVVYEPDGNIPPDFLVNRRIAIEVRRLNQAYDSGQSVKGLEETAIPLWKKFKELIRTFGPLSAGTSWFVCYTFSRPVPRWKKLQPKIQDGLKAFMANPPNTNSFDIAIESGFEIQLYRASKSFETFFVFGGHVDHESGGFLIAEMARWLQRYIDEKTEKIKEFRGRYPEWWLVFVDYIGYGLDDFDIEIFHDEVKLRHDLDKVIVVNPKNPSRYFEISSQ